MSTPEIEATATEQGWRPLDKFQGDPDKWVDAEEYVRRGETIMPLLKANNRRLEGEVGSLKSQNAALSSSLAEMRENMTEFSKQQRELLVDRLAQQRVELMAARVAARTDGNAVEEARLDEAIDTNKDKAKELAKPAPEPRSQATATEDKPPQEFLDWASANPWYGVDKRKTAIAMTQAQENIRSGLTSGKGFFDAIDTAIAEVFPPPKREPAADKTEGGRPSGGASSGRASSAFSSLPADAKAQAKKDAAKFVGPNKMFKTEEAWNNHYAEQYLAQG